MRKLLLMLIILPGFLQAESTLPAPSDEVILQISGNIKLTNADDDAHFDRAMIESLESSTIITANPILSKSVTDTGPVLADL